MKIVRSRNETPGSLEENQNYNWKVTGKNKNEEQIKLDSTKRYLNHEAMNTEKICLIHEKEKGYP
jgi:hypothetical protein